MPVTGIGGLFFRAADPAALRSWYATHLGVASADYSPWMQAAGPSLIMPFSADTDYFAADRQWMVNFRVSDLDGLLADLAAAGIAIITKAEWNSPETGRFARIDRAVGATGGIGPHLAWAYRRNRLGDPA